MADTQREIHERTEEEERLADDITTGNGGAWVLVSAHHSGDGEGLDVGLALGPLMDVELARRLLRKTLEAL